MTRLMRLLGLMASIGTLSLATDGAASTPRQDFIDRAKSVAQAFAGDRVGATLAADLKASHGVIVAPELVRAALGLGGHSGTGVLIRHDPETGTWSAPSFYDIGGAGLGPQLGFEKEDVILVITSADALNEMVAGDVDLGLDARVTMGSRNAGEQLLATQGEGADIHVYSRGQGAFVGAEVSATVLSAKDDWNATLGSQPIEASEILGPLAFGEGPGATSRFQ